MPTPDTPGALPAYLQISETLSRNILSGRFLDGEKLPTERAMAADFNIAIGTLRKALQVLEDQGLIERIHGSGNYVRHTRGARTIYSLFRLELKEGGGLPTARVLSADRLAKPDGFPNFGDSDTAFRFRRLRYLDDQPVASEEIWLDGGVASDISAADISDSLYYFYQQTLGVMVSSCTDRISIAPAPDWADAAFGPAPDTPCPFIERVALNQSVTPFEYSRTWVDATKADYVSRLK